MQTSTGVFNHAAREKTTVPHMLQPPSRITVLIAHSDPLIAAGLATTLRERGDFEVVVPSEESTVTHPIIGHAARADVAIADYDSGLSLLVSKELGTCQVLILTHRDSEGGICQALERGARGYLLQGCSVAVIRNAIRWVCRGDIALEPLVASRVAERMQQERPLTSREADILRHMMFGMSNKRIALKAELAVGTVKTHVKSILRKLGVASRTHAVAVAQRRGILPEESPPVAMRSLSAGELTLDIGE